MSASDKISHNESYKSTTKRKFTYEEDRQLEHLVMKFGSKNWSIVAEGMPNRSIRQCRERWKYFLSPSVSNKSHWNEEEDKLLLEQVRSIGPKWSKISKLFAGRSDVSIKNRYRSLLRNMAKEEIRGGEAKEGEHRRRIIELPAPISMLSL